jgi:hypothetical protein
LTHPRELHPIFRKHPPNTECPSIRCPLGVLF